MNECSFDGCTRPVAAVGLCHAHYQQQRRGKELAPLEKKKVKPNDTYCLKCDTQKTREDFYLRTNGKLQAHCIECMKTNANNRRARVAKAMRLLDELEAV